MEAGNGLLLVHAATWYNWQDDWPEYYRDFIGGGTRSHPPLGEFEVYVVDEVFHNKFLYLTCDKILTNGKK